MYGLIIGTLVLIYGTGSRGEPSACCSEITEHLACRNACEQVSVNVDDEALQLSQLSIMAENCPADLVNLWKCIDNTFEAVSGGGGGQWSGRKCCGHPLSTQCQNACHKATSAADLTENCPETETAFYRCVERQKWSTQCCNNRSGGPGSTTSRCKAVCKVIFIQDAEPTPSQSRSVREYCSSQVTTCISRKGITLHTPSQSTPEALECCDDAHTPECAAACRRAHTDNNDLTEDQILDLMEPECGRPQLELRMWQCFLTHAYNNKMNRRKQYHVDGAKLHCCKKGVNKQCRDLCVKTHGEDWNRHYINLMSCTANPVEAAMSKCLHEVEETCTMGCQGLDYCTNFNNRPTELFRSCNRMADEGARKEVAMWTETGAITLPEFQDFKIPIKDIRHCRPETWKTIACALQIKPCHLQGMRICKEDCLSVLRDCIDYNFAAGNMEEMAERVCNVLAPPGEDTTCLSLDEYIVPSPHLKTAWEVSLPCQNNPCSEKEVCLLNRRKCHHPETCKPYICLEGCPVGDASNFYVARESYVRIPRASLDRLHCHRVCRCGHHRSLLGCAEADCTESRQCVTVSQARIFQHGSRYTDDCNDCLCYSGQTICTKRECGGVLKSRRHGDADIDTPSIISVTTLSTGLPCRCRRKYDPVCGLNGRTYPSACIARCLGLKERHYDSGACQTLDPCEHQPCGEGEVCVARPTVCLDPLTYACHQYQCIHMAEGCNQHDHDPVCDTQQREWGNVCLMMSRGHQLAHHGHCLAGCQHSTAPATDSGKGSRSTGRASGGPVCGMNGETYASECAAWADRVPVDYMGRCATVGTYADSRAEETSCDDIQCPPLPGPATCRPLTPPGACCPICAGEIRLLYSDTLARSLASAPTPSLPPINLHNITTAFRRHIAVQQCDVFAYLSIEDDLVLLVMPTTSKTPTPLQVHACMVETEKLFTMFETQNPTLTSYLAVSPLLHAKLRLSTPIMSGSSSAATPTTNHITHTWLLPLLVLVTLLSYNHCSPHR